MPRLQIRKDGTSTLVIPKGLVEQRDWKKGQKLDLRFNERGNVEIFERK